MASNSILDRGYGKPAQTNECQYQKRFASRYLQLAIVWLLGGLDCVKDLIVRIHVSRRAFAA
jgi:hypothetical protein